MASKAVKISTEALNQIQEITDVSAEAKTQISEAINAAINELWIKVCKGEVNLLLTDENEFQVKPLPNYQEDAYSKLGCRGPYTVSQTCKSWVGLSDGLYKLKGHECFVPVCWFEKVEPKKAPSSTLTILLAIASLLQSGAIFAFLLL